MKQVNNTIAQLRKEAKAEADKEISTLKKRADKIPDSPSPVRVPAEPRESNAMQPTVTGRKKARVFIMPDVQPKAKKERKVAGPKQPKRATEAMILAKYPHARKGTLEFDEQHNKQSIEAKLECGHVARIFTSDLFQIKRCRDCRKSAQKETVKQLSHAKEQKRINKKTARKAG